MSEDKKQTMRVTKATLEEDIVVLKRQVEELNAELDIKEGADKKMRWELTRLLDPRANEVVVGRDKVFAGSYRTDRVEPEPGTWTQIAFWIGELKADANYAMVLEGRDEFRRASQQKSDLIARMRRSMVEAGVAFDFSGEELI